MSSRLISAGASARNFSFALFGQLRRARDDRAKPWRVFLYALPAAPLAALALALQILVPPLYADNLGLGLTAVAAVLLSARLFDIGSDLFIGYVSDKVRIPPGKRRFWMLLGLPLAALAAIKLFDPPGDADLVFLAVWTVVLYAGGTLIIVPFNAWGADIAVDYTDRTRITAWRNAAGMAGVVTLLIGLAQLGATGPDGGVGQIREVAYVCAPLMVLFVVAACVWIPDNARIGRKSESSDKVADTGLVREILREPAYRYFYLSFVTNGLANGIPAALFVMYTKYVLQADAKVGLFLLLYFGAALLSAGLWSLISNRIAKDALWRASLVLAIVAFSFVLLLGPGDILGFALVCLVTGVAFGADLILPGSITADLAKDDEQRHDRERAAGFYAVLGSLTKLGAALGVSSLAIVGLFGFDPDIADAPTWGLTVTYCLIPIALKVIVILQLWRHPPPRTE